MSEPDLGPDAVVCRAAGTNNGDVLHTDEDCKALRRARNARQQRLRQFPDPNWCQICTGELERGGGSRELYERAKQLGQTEVANDD